MRFTYAFVVSSALVSAVLAHETYTPQQLKVHEDLTAKALLCAPQIKLHVEQRKKAAAAQLLGTAQSTFQLDGAFDPAPAPAPPADSLDALLCAAVEPELKLRNSTCVLTPVVTQGPYYHDAGHPVRQNMAEDQLGLPFVMDVGVIDVHTCEPMEGVLIDVWHANSTGHYAGHPDQEEKLKWEGPQHEGPRKGLLSKYPRTQPKETFLRAAWPSNKNGVAQFTSVFPGYYTGRATHVHAKVHTKWTPVPENGTFVSDHLIHTGQFFVPDGINQQIDKMWPYNLNPIADKWGRTRNWDDALSIYQISHENGFGPTFELEKLGGVIQQGLAGFITMVVDSKASYNPTPDWSPHAPTAPAGEGASEGQRKVAEKVKKWGAAGEEL